jgi:AcrR family transcriptional regulator
MRLVQRHGSASLSSSDRCRQPTQATTDYSHHLHGPYHTVWYGSGVPTRSDWLQAGLAAVVDDGPNGLRIDRLCRRLGVSKGSFHHHFSGAADFKRSLLAAYEDLVVRALDQAIDQKEPATPQAALAGLTAAITSTPAIYRPELEVAMRAWAFSDAEVRTVQERVDRQRLKSLYGIWSQILDDPARAHIAALLPYLVAIGASLVQPPTPPDQLQRIYELLLGLVPDRNKEKGPTTS